MRTGRGITRQTIRVISLNSIKMNVVKTSPSGVVDQDTVFTFSERQKIVSAEYHGGRILEGFLVGRNAGNRLDFSYCQLQVDGKIDCGISTGVLSLTEEGKIRMTESFEWKSRKGKTGRNVFEEI